jgi:hypothetical protein
VVKTFRSVIWSELRQIREHLDAEAARQQKLYALLKELGERDVELSEKLGAGYVIGYTIHIFADDEQNAVRIAKELAEYLGLLFRKDWNSNAGQFEWLAGDSNFRWRIVHNPSENCVVQRIEEPQSYTTVRYELVKGAC